MSNYKLLDRPGSDTSLPLYLEDEDFFIPCVLRNKYFYILLISKILKPSYSLNTFLDCFIRLHNTYCKLFRMHFLNYVFSMSVPALAYKVLSHMPLFCDSLNLVSTFCVIIDFELSTEPA